MLVMGLESDLEIERLRHLSLGISAITTTGERFVLQINTFDHQQVTRDGEAVSRAESELETEP
jgi:hypothetical protein